ncbi:MAG: hypothetical protein JOY66_16420 [Acetobacteraceae bacterium]|nr:hypothetical protein [Acetobacteraceae bacterium]
MPGLFRAWAIRFGVGQYSMRVWLGPQEVCVRGLTPQDVVNVVPRPMQWDEGDKWA